MIAAAAVARAVALAIAGRIPAEGDESCYLGVAQALVSRGEQDVFWPPLTGWVDALAIRLLGGELVLLRAAMSALDLVNVVLVHDIATLVVGQSFDAARRDRIALVSALVYALYLPAIGFAISMTSEIPALTLVLVAVRLLLGEATSRAGLVAAAVALGLATLARSNLLVLAFAFAAVLPRASRRARLLFLVLSLVPPAIWTARNAHAGHGVVLATNASYNLYVGNSPDAQQELDLFAPIATPQQRAVRGGGEDADAAHAKAMPHDERQARAVAFVRDAPLRFVRRSFGRLARVFAPRTAHLASFGANGSVSRPLPAFLLLLALAQWIPVLFGGVLGLVRLVELRTERASLLVATVVGSLPLCLVALAKPRYSFPFEPFLVIGATTAAVARTTPFELGRPARWVFGLVSAFLAWGIVAWFVFAITSRG